MSYQLRLSVLWRIVSYLVLAGAATGFLWLTIMGSPALPRWIAMAGWIVIASPFVLAANQWSGTITIDDVGVTSNSVFLGARTIPWGQLRSVRLGVTSHARDDRNVTIRSQGLLGTKIAYSTMRDGFVKATRAVVLEAEKRDVEVKTSMLNPRREWDAYLGFDDPSPTAR